MPRSKVEEWEGVMGKDKFGQVTSLWLIFQTFVD